MFGRRFLPVGLVVAIALAMGWPGPGRMCDMPFSRMLMPVLIFLVNGYRAHVGALSMRRRQAGAFAWGAATCLLLGPLVGVAAANGLRLAPVLATGIIVMATVPPTLSSGVVITETSGGNPVLAMMLTMGLNLVGIVTIPMILPWALGEGPAAVSALTLFRKLLLLVLLPFAVGQIARRLLNARGETSAWLRYIPSAAIIATVWFTVSGSRDAILSVPAASFGGLLIAAAVLHGVLLAVARTGGGLLRLPVAEAKALTFVASQKTLPVALAVLVGLGDGLGHAVVACVVCHFFQLIADSVIAAHWRK